MIPPHHVLVFFFAAMSSSSMAAKSIGCTDDDASPILRENCHEGSDSTYWDVNGAGDESVRIGNALLQCLIDVLFYSSILMRDSA
eukprot:m.26613 g.26613  ORF g.26613 m.26613 type:complete len:85 (-) comp13360_c0_seq2:2398-2652(-)